MARIKIEDEDTPAAETAERSARDLEFFKEHLRGKPIEAIAAAAGVSPSTVYRIAKRDRWSTFKFQLDSQSLRQAVQDIAREREAKRRFDELGLQLADDGRYFIEHRVLIPPTQPRFGIIPADSAVVEQVSHDRQTGVIRVRTWLSALEVERLRRGQPPGDGGSAQGDEA